MSKFARQLLTLIFLCFLLTACGGGGSTGSTNTTTDGNTDVTGDEENPSTGPLNQDDPALVNKAPVLALSSDASVQVDQELSVSGAVSDDGLPSDTLTINWYKSSGPGDVDIVSPDSLSTQMTFSREGSYVMTLSAHDGELVTELSIRVAVTINIPDVINSAPTVNAGPDTTAVLGAAFSLEAVATDDGLPNDALSYQWEQVKGPSASEISPSTTLKTSVKFTREGSYAFQITADDGALSSTDTVNVEVSKKVTPLSVSAGADIEVDFIPNEKITLNGVIAGDVPADAETSWSLVSGPKPTVSFDSQEAKTAVLLPKAGVYVLRLAVKAGATTTHDDMQITANLLDNKTPQIAAIADQSILFGEVAKLSASVTDDGQPIGKLYPQWSVESSPAGATEPTFDKTDAMDVVVSFSEPGTYQFLFNVDDGELGAEASMEVEVKAYEVTSFNNGIEVSMPVNYLPEYSYDAEWVMRVWEGVNNCLSPGLGNKLQRIYLYKEGDYDASIHDNQGDPNSWTVISIVADDVKPDPEGSQGYWLADAMVNFNATSKPIDGSIVCGENHSGRRHAIEPTPVTNDKTPITQELPLGDLNIVVRAKELKQSTVDQLALITEHLTKTTGSGESVALKEIRIVDDPRHFTEAEVWNSYGGFSVRDSYVILLRDSIVDDLSKDAGYVYPGEWIDSYLQAVLDVERDDEHWEVDNLGAVLSE